jgi:hypothetical protein
MCQVVSLLVRRVGGMLFTEIRFALYMSLRNYLTAFAEPTGAKLLICQGWAKSPRGQTKVRLPSFAVEGHSL